MRHSLHWITGRLLLASVVGQYWQLHLFRLDHLWGKPWLSVPELQTAWFEVSPGGKWIAILGKRSVSAQRGVFLFDPSDVLNHPRLWVEARDARRLAWSPDGRQLAAGDGAGLLFIGSPEGAPRRLSLPAPIVALQWSPDGRWLAVLAGSKSRPSGPPSLTLWLVSVPEGKPLRLATQVVGMAWSPKVQPFGASSPPE